MHILIVNDDGPPSPQSSPYVHLLVRDLQSAGHTVSVCLPHTQRSWIGKAHMIGQTVKPLYYRPPPSPAPPAGLHAESTGSTHARPTSDPNIEEWVLVDGTPASCVQIGLYHFFRDRGPVDLVVSGPNYGRNTTAVFALSSGTLGGALEAAVCRHKAIALSYAFFSRNHDPEIVGAASRHGVRVIEALVRQWPEDGSVDLYSVNVPLVEGVEKNKTLWTGMLQNYWMPGSCFSEVEGSVGGEREEEERIREGSEGEKEGEGQGESVPAPMKHFKWSPKFADVYKSVDDAEPGNDGWAVREGHTSVTPLKANFWQAATHLHKQELELDTKQRVLDTSSSKNAPIIPIPASDTGKTAVEVPRPHLHALIAYGDNYVQPLILSALKSLVPEDQLTLLSGPPADAPVALQEIAAKLPPNSKLLQVTPYETIDFEYAAFHPNTTLINSYVIRKALIRKHFLSTTVEYWVAKHPDSILAGHVKRSEAFEVDYAEFLDDALIEAFDLRASLEKNDELGSDCDEDEEKVAQGVGSADSSAAAGRGHRLPDEHSSLHDEHSASLDGGLAKSTAQAVRTAREWWILKPGMSDRGQGIKLFSTMDELQGIFDAWEEDMPNSEDEDEDDDAGGNDDESAQKIPIDVSARGGSDLARNNSHSDRDESENIMTSHLRHFVAQPYIHPPLLLPDDPRKFHIRTYVVCVGALKVYVYRDMLALFAAKPYLPPWESRDLDGHLTNTCLQGDGVDDPSSTAAAKGGSVKSFWALESLDSAAPSGMSPGKEAGTPAISKEAIFKQICDVTGELFEAAARGMVTHFQPLGHAFEVYGLDFLVDAAGTAWLLEVNAFPDFKQTGGELSGIVAEFWAEVLRLAVGPFIGIGSGGMGDRMGKAVLVRDIDLGRR